MHSNRKKHFADGNFRLLGIHGKPYSAWQIFEGLPAVKA